MPRSGLAEPAERPAETASDDSQSNDSQNQAPPEKKQTGTDDEADWSDNLVETSVSAFPTTASETHLDARELSTATRRTAEDYIELVPGFHTVQHGNEGKGHQFYVRGFDAVHGADLEVRLDGIPLNEPSNIHGNGYLDLGAIIPETVLEVSARKGAFEVDQGPFATAASLEYELGVPRWERGVRTLYQIGTTNRHRLAAIIAPKSTDESTFGAVEAVYDAGFGSNRRTRRVSATGKATLWRDSNAQLSALALGYASDFGLPGALRLQDYRNDRVGYYDSYTDRTAGKSLRAIASMRYQADYASSRWDIQTYGQARKLELDENYTGMLLYPERGDRRLQRERAWTAGARGRYTKRLLPTLKLQALAEWRATWTSQVENNLTRSAIPWRRQRSLGFTAHFGAAGLSADWSPVDWLRLTGGGRIDGLYFDATDYIDDVSGSQTFVQASPRVKASVFAGRHWTFFASYGRGLRPPEARAVIRPDDNGAENQSNQQYTGGSASPTTNDNVEIGTLWTPLNTVEVSLAGFGIWIDRESIFDHISGTNLELNPTRRTGLEAAVRWKPAPWLSLSGSATAVDASFTGSGNPVPGAPRFLVSALASLVHPDGWRGGLEVQHIGRRPLAHGASAAPFTVVNASAGYRWEWLQLDAQLENAVGSKFREGEYHFASSWNPNKQPSSLPAIHYVAGSPRALTLTVSAWF